MERARLWAALLVVSAACSRPLPTERPPVEPPKAMGESPSRGDPPVTPAAAAQPAGARNAGPGQTPAPTAAAPDDHVIGAPKSFENLTIFPVSSKSQEDLGPFTTLDDALAKKIASVREIGSEADARASGAQVNTLVIENRGAVPIYILAGTIVKGGKQDRQIGDDFIVGANQTVPVDAYCVEHGRWTTDRDGVATAGQFATLGVLTNSQVRAAGQYRKDQSEVWSKVAAVNASNRKEAASGTLLATVDAADVVARRNQLSARVQQYLGSLAPAESQVGLGYAVNGNVRAVRWFANHRIFELFRSTLVNTAAMEAITAPELASPAPPPSPAAVTHFVDDIQKASVKEHRSPQAADVVDVRESASGYGSSTSLKPPAAAAPAKPRTVSVDFMAH